MPLDYFTVLSSLLAAEMARMRRVSELEAALCPITLETRIGAQDLGIDSLGMLELASAVSQMFHLHEAGVDEYLLRHRKVSDWVEIVRTSLARKGERLTFRTSGSTGRPKPCTHRIADLQQEVEIHAAQQREVLRIVTLVPRHHIYGFLWTVMLADQLGAEVLDGRLWTPQRLAAQVRARDLIVATPSTWQMLSNTIQSFPAGVKAVSSGAHCPADLWAWLSRAATDTTDIYGSSETAGIARRTNGRMHFELLPCWNRSALDSLRRIGSGEEVPLPDRVEWLGETSFVIKGRRDDAVQILGTNVFPNRVAECLRRHPLVRDCAVRLMTPTEGDRLKAFVVLIDVCTRAQAEMDLAAWLKENLQPHERPAHFTFGDAIPRNAMGKPMDWSIPAEVSIGG